MKIWKDRTERGEDDEEEVRNRPSRKSQNTTQANLCDARGNNQRDIDSKIEVYNVAFPSPNNRFYMKFDNL
jgi:hypothetical protein